MLRLFFTILWHHFMFFLSCVKKQVYVTNDVTQGNGKSNGLHKKWMPTTSVILKCFYLTLRWHGPTPKAYTCIIILSSDTLVLSQMIQRQLGMGNRGWSDMLLPQQILSLCNNVNKKWTNIFGSVIGKYTTFHNLVCYILINAWRRSIACKTILSLLIYRWNVSKDFEELLHVREKFL